MQKIITQNILHGHESIFVIIYFTDHDGGNCCTCMLNIHLVQDWVIISVSAPSLNIPLGFSIFLYLSCTSPLWYIVSQSSGWSSRAVHVCMCIKIIRVVVSIFLHHKMARARDIYGRWVLMIGNYILFPSPLPLSNREGGRVSYFIMLLYMCYNTLQGSWHL